MKFPVSRPLAMCAISWKTPPFDRISHSLRVFSLRRKSKILFGGTRSQEKVAALSTIPEDLPGSSTLLLVMTPTSSAPVPDSVDVITSASPAGMLVVMVLVRHSYCRSRVATHHFAGMHVLS
ncbi:hypothetical protein OIU78_019503 [Salix suchowensis]|nr:hypothetical protein OIU78_019503 [Salix suchowensis]